MEHEQVGQRAGWILEIAGVVIAGLVFYPATWPESSLEHMHNPQVRAKQMFAEDIYNNWVGAKARN